jgi:hexokinase
MEEKWLVGVDLGGTTIKMAIISLNGDILYRWEIDTDKRDSGRHITSSIKRSIDQKLNELNQTKDRLIGIQTYTLNKLSSLVLTIQTLSIIFTNQLPQFVLFLSLYLV